MTEENKDENTITEFRDFYKLKKCNSKYQNQNAGNSNQGDNPQNMISATTSKEHISRNCPLRNIPDGNRVNNVEKTVQ